jgi:hypothetical protein
MLPQGAYPGGGHLTRNNHRQGELTEERLRLDPFGTHLHLREPKSKPLTD